MDSSSPEAATINTNDPAVKMAVVTPRADKEVTVDVNFLGTNDSKDLAWEVNANWGDVKTVNESMGSAGGKVDLGFVNLGVEPGIRKENGGINRGDYDITLSTADGVIGNFDLSSKGELMPASETTNGHRARLVLADPKSGLYRYYVMDSKGENGKYAPLMGLEFKKEGVNSTVEGSTSYVFPEGTLTVYPQEWISVNDKRAMPDDRKGTKGNCGAGGGASDGACTS